MQGMYINGTYRLDELRPEGHGLLLLLLGLGRRHRVKVETQGADLTAQLLTSFGPVSMRHMRRVLPWAAAVA